jgi:hypothetical protein
MNNDETNKPPNRLQEATHRALGEMLRVMQERYDAGEMVCLAGVWLDETGMPYVAVAGLDVGDRMPHYLKKLADTVVDYGAITNEDDEPARH